MEIIVGILGCLLAYVPYMNVIGYIMMFIYLFNTKPYSDDLGSVIIFLILIVITLIIVFTYSLMERKQILILWICMWLMNLVILIAILFNTLFGLGWYDFVFTFAYLMWLCKKCVEWMRAYDSRQYTDNHWFLFDV